MPLKIKAKKNCRWDLVALGEVMLRFDPGDGASHTARTFEVWEGGGEYNVARGLKRCFGSTRRCDGVCRRPGRPAGPGFHLQGGVDQTFIKWVRIRRHRPHGAQRTEFHRARLRRARRGGLLRSRPHGGLAAEARRHRLGRNFRQTRRALVPHRRHFLRALRVDAGGGAGSDEGGARNTARSFRTI